ncbi:hypothetical protein BX600DRAFT_447416 [Xylariales sp. PMI_506]|nr:hypothetical protein BX600DRAFT_447416 [Xylariales sp. PMI_506]
MHNFAQPGSGTPSMSTKLSEDAILADFDRRHQDGVIFYDSDPEIRLEVYNGFQFELAVTGAISKKPYIKDNADEPVSVKTEAPPPPGYAPGSDIAVSGYEIGDVSDTHFLAFNKFCMYRPHMLLMTKDGYRRQYEPLDLDDFQSAWNTLEALRWRYFMFFNCGKDGGCSRLHKHLQIAPYLPDRLLPWPEASPSAEPENLPYRYILRRFEADLGPKQLTDLYKQMMVEARQILGLDKQGAVHVAHNVLLGRRWILVIPRRKAGVGGAYANSLGMLGMVSVASKEELDLWLDQGPHSVVSQLGVAKGKIK